jgi:exopolysaccharide production protein ExoZ
MSSQTIPAHENPPSLNTPAQNTPTKLPALQALRGIAALLVVVHHVAVMSQFDQIESPWVVALRDNMRNFGSIGVAIFFVLSGFVITYSVFGKKNQPSATDFLLKRITRIYPPYFFYSVIAFLLYFVSTVMVNHSPADWGYLIKSFLFIPTYDSDGKFFPVLMVGWTLIFEMYFYLLFFLALCCRRTYWQTIILYFVLFCLGGSIATMVVADGNVYAHVYGSRHLWSFFFGALLFSLYQLPVIHTKRFRWAIALCVSAGLILLFYAHFKTPIYRRLSILLFAVSCVAFALTSFANQGLAGKIANKLGILGDASYSLYLYHSLAIIIISGLWKRDILLPPVVQSATSFLLQVTFLVVLLTAISIPLYQLIERPITNADNYRRVGRWIYRLIFTKKPYTQSIS